MKPFVLAAMAAATLSAAPALAQGVGNPVIARSTVDGCSSCTFVLNQAFPTPGVAVGGFSFYADRALDIVPLLLSQTVVGNTATFSVLAIGQQRTASLGVNNFSFNTQSGVNLTTANSYFGFAYPGLGVVSFDYFSTATSAGAFAGPAGYVPSAVGDSFTSSTTLSNNAYGALNDRTYSIAAAAVPEPATWALMIGGFGLAGFGMRRRKVATTVRFA